MVNGSKIKNVTLEELAGYLDGISWEILAKAVQYKDKELIELFNKIQSFVDKAVFGK